MIAVGTRSMRRAIAGLAIAVVLGASGCSSGDEGFGIEDIGTQDAAVEVVDFDYVIPAGAGLALDAGEPLSVLPADLDARVGQTIRIVNEDDRGHLVGPWFVGAGETLRQRFASPGEFIGECTVHPSGLITVTVSA